MHRLAQHLALLGENQSARVAMEKRRAKLVFERANLTADRRLAQAKGFAGMSEGTGLGGRLENAQLIPVHHALRRAPPPIGRASLLESPPGARSRLFPLAGISAFALAYSAAARAGSCAASQRSASSAAMQPSPAAVTAWRKTWSATSPAAKTPSMLVAVEPGLVAT